ncbi:hypothetical protein BH10CYA1_BH10CYA1_45980 [soil metagenome]
MTTAEHREFSTGSHTRDTQREGEHRGHHNPDFNRRELLGSLPEACAYRHVRSTDDEHQSLHFTSPYEHADQRAAGHMEHTRREDAAHDRQLAATEANVERHLRHNDHNFAPVFGELNHLRNRDSANIERDLQHINNTMHSRGLLNGQEIIRDDRGEGHGWGVVAEDKQNKEREGHRDGTMVSTSHAPQESDQLRRHYANVHQDDEGQQGHGGQEGHRGHQGHHGRHHYNGWHQSAEGGGGAHGGTDTEAVGGHVPPGARRELIEEALRLAGVPITEHSISAVNTIVSRESGWNPNITNNWDSNARAGHPSTGLMQTIPSTFRQFALSGMNNNIHDPLSNLVAGIRYAEARYGGHGTSGVERVASRPGGY